MSNETMEKATPDDIQWESFTTAKGRKYEVGYSQGTVTPSNSPAVANASFAEAADAPTAAEGKQEFGIAVNWPVGSQQWQNTSSDVRARSAITRYMLYEYDGSYKYMLEFSNEEHYNYYFYDETGDSYQVNTFRNGDHYVRYDSAQPTIVYISGS